MLTIQTTFYVASNIDLINYLVCVLLKRSCEDYYFIVFCHRLYELDAPWSHQEIAFCTELQNNDLNNQLTSTLWIRVSSRSSTRQYFLSGSTGPKNGGETFGRFWKLFGKVAAETLAIALAFNIAKGFLPVKFVWPYVPYVLPFYAGSELYMLPADFAPAPYTGPPSVLADKEADAVRSPPFA